MNRAAQRVPSERLGISERNAAAAGSSCGRRRLLVGATDVSRARQQSGGQALRELLESGSGEDACPACRSSGGRPGAGADVEESMGSLRSPEEAMMFKRLRRVYASLLSSTSVAGIVEALGAALADMVPLDEFWWVDAETRVLWSLPRGRPPLRKRALNVLASGAAEVMEAVLAVDACRRVRVEHCAVAGREATLLAVPVRIGDRVLGAMAQLLPCAAEVDEEACEVFESSSDAVALAIDRARLREQLAEEELRREELIQSKQLSAVGSLAAGVAHEIRNPLAAMMNAVSLLHQGTEPGSEERQLTGIVLEESRRMNRIVGEFLSFTRPSSNPRPTARIDQVIRSTIRLLERDPICASDVELSLDLEDGLPGVVADRDRVRQVLWNLLLNAVQAAGERGRVVVTARTESRDARPGVAIAVDDSGPGIPACMRERVFAPFETSKPNGTGLGLSLVRHIVDSYGGEIRIAGSELGGARVWLWLACDRKRERRKGK